jgi:hypothetical protein
MDSPVCKLSNVILIRIYYGTSVQVNLGNGIVEINSQIRSIRSEIKVDII